MCAYLVMVTLTASVVVHALRCICGAFYVGGTALQLSIRNKEYHPRWLN